MVLPESGHDVKMKQRKYVLFAIAGAAAGILQQPLFNGWLKLPENLYLNLIAPGVIFTLSITIADTLMERNGGSTHSLVKRYVLGGLVLIVGMPVALLAGAVSLEAIDRVMQGGRYQLGGIGLPFFLAEIVSCVVWSAALLARTVLANRIESFQIMLALFSTTAIMVIANLAEIVSKTLWQKTLLLPTISIAEEIGSALVLAAGCTRYLEKL
ncbi:MAG TPA: hypothetical protein VMU05_25495 [Dongiaceae bacterium]|nr:hypothetical protein [Dongiaceae bacterium]